LRASESYCQQSSGKTQDPSFEASDTNQRVTVQPKIFLGAAEIHRLLFKKIARRQFHRSRLPAGE
jgi:hypothetical protein